MQHNWPTPARSFIGLDWPSRPPRSILCHGRLQYCYRAYLDENVGLDFQIYGAMHHTCKSAYLLGVEAEEPVENCFLEHLIYLCVKLTGYPYTSREVKTTAMHFEVMDLEL